MTVRIVTDSSADIPDKLVKEYGIGVVPLNIHFGEEVFKDGIDIRSEEFYHRLKNEPALPNTSQPAPGEFLRVYREIAKPGDTIISLHISSKMSGIAGPAQIAADMLADQFEIHVLDSRTVCMGLGLLVIRAARLCRKGLNAAAIIEQITQLQRQLTIYFTVNSLEYLSRTGRIGKATAFLGGLLSIKPLLGIEDGIIIPVEKIRGSFPKIASEMVNRFKERFGDQPLEISVVHTEMPELAEILSNVAKENLNIGSYSTGIIGPIVGTHAGPHTIGIIGLPL